MEKKQQAASCETCIHHVFDEDFYAYFCDMLLDEDELSRYAFGSQISCPFYQFHDEYISVRKQI